MKFNVTVQGQFYKTIDAPNTGAALAKISHDIAAGLVTHLDPDAAHDISITPQPPDPFDKWAAIAPATPSRFDTWTAPDATQWIYDQPREADGRYVADDPATPDNEAQLRWQPIVN